MPMLITFLIGFPVNPLNSSGTDVGALNCRILLEHGVDILDDVRPSTISDCCRRHAQRHVQHGPVLGHVDVLAAEHRVAPLRHPGLGRELDEQPHRLVGDPVLRVVKVDARRPPR